MLRRIIYNVIIIIIIPTRVPIECVYLYVLFLLSGITKFPAVMTRR